MRIILATVLSLAASAAAAVQPLFAPPVPVGEIEVVLHASSSVTANTPVVASFGVPFPRGSMVRSGPSGALDRLRVFDGDTEIAAYVAELTPWRHRTNAQIDNQSVRVALVQVEVTFPNPATAKRVTVRWGGAPRTLNRATRAVRAATWAPVTSGSFVAADGVLEPRVIAQLPASWLSLGALGTAQALPFDATNTPARDSPAAMDAITTWPGTQEAERAHKNFFYTAINEDTPGTTTCAYKTGTEPWLYDRSATMFSLYFRSASPKALREALRSADFYRAHLNAGGGFTLGGDNKYSFNESLAYAYWVTGDDTFLPAITATATAHDGTAHSWNAGLNFWTERAVAFKLMAHTIDYEVNGTTARRNSVNAIVQALGVHQDGAALPVPVNGRLDGGWYHTGRQHDASEMPATQYGASAWMTVLLTDALRRAYLTAEDLPTANMIRRSGTFLRGTLRLEASEYGGQSWAPRYIVEWNGTDFDAPVQEVVHDEDHALDVDTGMAWADYFGALTGQRDPMLEAFVTNVYDTFDRGVNDRITPGRVPAFFLFSSRCRQWSWEHRISGGLSWARQAANVEDTPDDPDRVFADSFE